MKTEILATKNGSSVTVAIASDFKLHIVDADGQMTKDILPDGTYQGEGCERVVKNGWYVKPKKQDKAKTLHSEMKTLQNKRRQHIKDQRLLGKDF